MRCFFRKIMFLFKFRWALGGILGENFYEERNLQSKCNVIQVDIAIVVIYTLMNEWIKHLLAKENINSSVIYINHIRANDCCRQVRKELNTVLGTIGYCLITISLFISIINISLHSYEYFCLLTLLIFQLNLYSMTGTRKRKCRPIYCIFDPSSTYLLAALEALMVKDSSG